MKNKNTYGLIAFTVVLCWALWNYSVSLELLDKFYKIILPFLIGGFIAFIVNVLMTKLEVVWDKFFSKGPLDKLEKVKRVACLILSIALIAAFLAFTVLLVLPELNSSVKTLIKLIPPAVEKMNVYLQEKAAQFNMFEDDFLYLQKQWNNAYETIFKFIQDNKSLLLSRTWIATTTVVDVVTNFAIGIVAAVYLLLEKDVLARSLKRTIYAFTTKERADYLVKAGKITQLWHTLDSLHSLFTSLVAMVCVPRRRQRLRSLLLMLNYLRRLVALPLCLRRFLQHLQSE